MKTLNYAKHNFSNYRKKEHYLQPVEVLWRKDGLRGGVSKPARLSALLKLYLSELISLKGCRELEYIFTDKIGQKSSQYDNSLQTRAAPMTLRQRERHFLSRN